MIKLHSLYTQIHSNAFFFLRFKQVVPELCPKHTIVKRHCAIPLAFMFHRCDCTPGYVGEHCDIDFDDCQDNKCKNGAQCTDAVNGYTCICPEGYRWERSKGSMNMYVLCQSCFFLEVLIFSVCI